MQNAGGISLGETVGFPQFIHTHRHLVPNTGIILSLGFVTFEEAGILYLVAIKVPAPYKEQLQTLQASLRPAEWRITMEPHITLLAPGRPLCDPEEAVTQFRILRLAIPPFTITSSRTTMFERRHHSTVILEVHPKPALKLLVSKLVAASTWQVTSATTKRPHIPHITLVNQVPVQRRTQTIQDLKSVKISIHFECTSITLFAKESRWPHWTELAQLPLTKE